MRGKEMDQYFTGASAAELLVDVTTRFCTRSPPRLVCEPCAGDGALVKALLRQHPECEVLAYDLDETLATKHEWKCADFLSTNVEPISGCDFVLCNPPFKSGRAAKGNAKRGKDLTIPFIMKALKFAPLLGFILHQNKGAPQFASKIWKQCPNLRLVHHELLRKTDSTFDTGDGPGNRRFVPCAIYVWQLQDEAVPKPIEYKSTECPDFCMIPLNDDRCNLIVKTWGSKNRAGRVVATDASDIAEEVARERKIYGAANGTNVHLFCTNVQKVVDTISRMEGDLNNFLSYARDTPNVKITPAQFVWLYNKNRT